MESAHQMAVTWMHCQERHYETGRQTHMCQDANSRLLSREVDGSARTRHGQELSTYSRFRRMQYAKVRRDSILQGKVS